MPELQRRAPLQNRVDPFGALHAIDARGALMGNRGGRFHRDDRTLGARRFASRRWIACVCAFKGRHRDVWGAGYTELFFLDEATALAAGHRPCFECRRADALRFQAAFPFARGEARNADAMDARLHRERLKPWRADVLDLPDGAMFARDGAAFLIRNGAALPWSFAGYGSPQARGRGVVDALSAPCIVETLARGYTPRWLR